MTTSELPGVSAGAAPADESRAFAGFAVELERLANQFFANGPGAAVPQPAASLTAAPAAPSVGPMPAPFTPPNPGPNALAVGAGGASPAVTLPPVPGVLKQPPLMTAPAPKESDLRALPAMFSDSLGAPSPLALVRPVENAGGSQPGGTPYFLELAGLPTSGAAQPPGTNGMPLPGGAPLPSSALPGGTPSPGSGTLPSGVPSGGVPSGGVPPVSSVPSPGGMPGSSQLSAPPKALSGFRFEPELDAARPSTPQLFDAHAVKRDFPILQQRVNNRPLVWLDNAATTQKPRAVIERLRHFYENENSNIHRAAHALAARSTDAYEAARATSARFLNAPSSKNIVFVRGTTEAINLVAQSWGRRHIGAGDEIVITWLEHHANIVPWQMLCREKGARLCVAPVDDDGQIILEEYERLLGPRTRLVSLGHVSNALGTIVPAREMVEIAHRYGARVFVDGAQAVSHQRVDVQALDADFYAFSGHKIFGPTGIGVLYGKTDVLEHMPPWQGGGNMIDNVTFEKTSYRPAPDRFEAGTGNIADAVGLGAALDYVSALGMENIARHEHELLVYATERLLAIPGLRLFGNAADKAAVLSFLLDGHHPEDVGKALDQEGIAVRSGHHCAQPILRRFGVEATVRASLAPYNTREDVDALVSALKRLQSGGFSRH
jgi:cysteine desulfurase/selenocysteine lyase